MLNLKFQYNPLVQVKVLHNFYSKQTSDELKLIPTPRTVTLMEKMNLMVREKDGALFIIYDHSRAEALSYFLHHYDHIKFSFWLRSSNTYFINFTNLPTESTHSILYFHNQEAREDPGEQLLHQGDFVDLQNIYNIKPSAFGYTPSTDNTTVEVKDLYGNTVQQGKVENGLKFQVDVSKTGEGRYSIWEDGKEMEIFVYPGADMAMKPIALVEIELTEDIKNGIIDKIKQEQQVSPIVYKVCFNSRSTYWRYFITSKYLNGLNKVEILSHDSAISFSGPEEVTLVNGDKAFLFLSDQELPLKEFSGHVFQLKKNDGKSGTDKTLLNRLPFPTVESIKPESRSNDSKIYSEIIVYL